MTDLLALAAGRKGTLWSSLIANAGSKPLYQGAADTLKRWRSRADYAPPFEFFASILDREGARAKFLARLGPEAADPLDEFLNLALSYDDRAPPSLTGFLAYLRETDAEVKRDMEHGRNEVRVMTVHGAKGLEAPIVFLPDTCTTASGGTSAVLDLPGVELPKGIEAPPFVWSVKGTASHAAVAGARQVRAALEAEERHRLLYVAMTRARDRLYVAGFEGKKAPSRRLLVQSRARSPERRPHQGNRFRRRDCVAPGRATIRRREGRQGCIDGRERARAAAGLGDEGRAARADHCDPPRALAPRGVRARRGRANRWRCPRDRASGPSRPSPHPCSARTAASYAARSPTHCCSTCPPCRNRAGTRRRRASSIGAGQRCRRRRAQGIVRETLAILTAPEFAPLFGPQSRAEVPVVALLPNPKRKGAPLKLVGQIDRLVDLGKEVLIVDYKTNRPPPKQVEAVAPAYLLQLAAYRLALVEIYPGRTVRAALLWTDGPRIMQLPGAVLDQYSLRLWELDISRLDAGEGHS